MGGLRGEMTKESFPYGWGAGEGRYKTHYTKFE
ncbi:hypothetical protein X928_04690 [Petrotoga miotherma DSM 10691]|uniref:Uncharacterized protein n=1 Tax=Petrotoga miotherma DSM 10691 TaxID=1434326 RepID=A0A2K1PCT3_9BACT|nr:hypothetical protein X928_04690 [Petrotoga miotherma DSM 10691]